MSATRRDILLGAGAAAVAAALPAMPLAAETPPPIIHVLCETVIEHGQEFLPGWYFWDEIWVDRHGPFATREDALDCLNVYCAHLLWDA